MTDKTTSTKGATTTDTAAAEKSPGWIVRTGTAIGSWFGRHQAKFKTAGLMAVGAGAVVAGQAAHAYYENRKQGQALLTN